MNTEQVNSEILSDLEAYLSDRAWESQEQRTNAPENIPTLTLTEFIEEYNTMRIQQNKTALEISDLRMERAVLRIQVGNLKKIVSDLSELTQEQAVIIQNQEKTLANYRYAYKNSFNENTNIIENTKSLEKLVKEVTELYLGERKKRVKLEESLDRILTNGDQPINFPKQEDEDGINVEETKDLGKFGHTSIELFCNKYEEVMEVGGDKDKLIESLREGLGRPEKIEKDSNLVIAQNLKAPKKPKRSLVAYTSRAETQPMTITQMNDVACRTDDGVVLFVNEDEKSPEENITEPTEPSMDISTLASTSTDNVCHIFRLFKFSRCKV